MFNREGAGFLRDFFRDRTTNLSWTTASTSSAGADTIPGQAGLTLFIQRITALVSTPAAQTMTIRSTTGSVVVGLIPATPTTGAFYDFEWGEDGKALPEGAGLDIVVTAAGLGVEIHVEAYARQTGVLAPGGL